MTTTKSIAALFATLIVLSIVASYWKPEPAPAGKTPLVWVSDNNPARTEQIAAFNRENPQFNLKLDYGNTGPQKVILQCSSGVGPDIYDYGDDQMESYVAAGVVWDVTDAAKKLGFYGPEVGWPGGVNTYTYRGRQYGFPCNTGCQILIYNKNVFDHFGVPYPQGTLTWDEFLEIAKKVNDPTGKLKGKKIYAATGIDFRNTFENQRGEYFNEDGSLNIAENQELRTAFDMLREYVFKERIMPTQVDAKQLSGQGGWGSGNLNQFATANYAMAVTGYWSLIAFSRAYQKQVEYLNDRGISEESIKNPLERPLRIGAVMIPHFAGKPAVYRVGSRVAGINSRSPRREEALKFLQYLAGPTYSKLLNEAADFLPGNAKYADLGVDPGPEALNRIELQNTTVQAMSYGYTPRFSEFLLMGDVLRVLRDQSNRLESNPSISTDSILEAANRELKTLTRRNLDRNLQLRERFIKQFGEEAYKKL